MINREYNCVFVHINKTAGQSIEKVLGWSQHPKSDHRTIHDYQSQLGQDLQGMFSFTVIRNPYSKMVSMYHGRRQNLNSPRPQGLSFWQWILEIHEADNLHPAILRGTTNQLDWIASPQWQWDQEKAQFDSAPAQLEIQVDHIMRFETLRRDWYTVSQILGLDKQLPHLNTSEHDHYSEYYDSSTEQIVRQRFKRDFQFLYPNRGDTSIAPTTI